jgi:hypothetical protein
MTNTTTCENGNGFSFVLIRRSEPREAETTGNGDDNGEVSTIRRLRGGKEGHGGMEGHMYSAGTSEVWSQKLQVLTLVADVEAASRSSPQRRCDAGHLMFSFLTSSHLSFNLYRSISGKTTPAMSLWASVWALDDTQIQTYIRHLQRFLSS